MEEKLNKKQKVWSWLKKYGPDVALMSTTLFLVYNSCKLGKRVGDLAKENRRLEGENFDLKGQISANERENRRLSRENGNLNYQLGKLVAVMKK